MLQPGINAPCEDLERLAEDNDAVVVLTLHHEALGQVHRQRPKVVFGLATRVALRQRLRADVVTERNNREAYQSIAPAVENGLYLVPKVIE